MNKLNEYTVVVSYPFFLTERKWRGFAESAEDAIRIVFTLATGREAKRVEEYTGTKQHPDRCFSVEFGHREEAVLFIEEKTMKHIVNEVNIFTSAILTTYEFSTAADAMEYAMAMNENMEATPIRYKYVNKEA